MPARRIPVEQRLREKTDLDGPIPAHRPELGPCHMFTGFRDWDGYGKLQIGRKSIAAHRVQWELAHGPIEKGLMVCHHCDNPSCVRLSHLFLGDALKNSHDAMDKGRLASGDDNGARLHPEKLARGDRNGSRLYPERLKRGDEHPARLNPGCRRGVKNGHAKLNESGVQAIRLGVAAGETDAYLAYRFGVNPPAIYKIRTGRTWKHLPLVNSETE